MKCNRRLFLGAAVAGTASLLAPRAFAQVRAAERPDLLPRALMALDTHAHRIANRDLVGLVDFSVHSREARFHLVSVANGRVLISFPASATPMMIDSPQPRWQHSSAVRITSVLPVASKL